MSFWGLHGYKIFLFSVVLSAIALTILGLALERMVVLWPNAISYIVFALVGATIGFVIYGFIKGFENTFPDD